MEPEFELDFEFFKQVINDLGFKASLIAKRAGVAPSTVSRIASGKLGDNVGFGTVAKIARFLRMDIRAFQTKVPFRLHPVTYEDKNESDGFMDDLVRGKTLISCSPAMDCYLLPDELALINTRKELEDREVTGTTLRKYLDLCQTSFYLRRDLRRKRDHTHRIVGSDATFLTACTTSDEWVEEIRAQARSDRSKTALGIIPAGEWQTFHDAIAKVLGVSRWQKVNIADGRLAGVWLYSKIYKIDHRKTVERLLNTIEEYASKMVPHGFISRAESLIPKRMRQHEIESRAFLDVMQESVLNMSPKPKARR